MLGDIPGVKKSELSTEETGKPLVGLRAKVDFSAPDRGWPWYVIMGVILTIIFTGFINTFLLDWGDIVAAVIILAGLVTYGFLGHREGWCEVAFTSRGVTVDKLWYAAANFDEYFFAIIPEGNILYLREQGKKKRLLKIPIKGMSLSKLRTGLKKLDITEDQRGTEPWLDLWIRALRL